MNDSKNKLASRVLSLEFLVGAALSAAGVAVMWHVPYFYRTPLAILVAGFGAVAWAALKYGHPSLGDPSALPPTSLVPLANVARRWPIAIFMPVGVVVVSVWLLGKMQTHQVMPDATACAECTRSIDSAVLRGDWDAARREVERARAFCTGSESARLEEKIRGR